MDSLVPISEINASETTFTFFTHQISLLFEDCPELIQHLYSKRLEFQSYDQVIEASSLFIQNLSYLKRIQILNAHPRIGQTQPMSHSSAREQGQDTLHSTMQTLALLNEEYESIFGFKFVCFVNGRSKEEMILVIEKRMDLFKRIRSEPIKKKTMVDEEMYSGLKDMISIAYDRLRKG